MRGSLKIGKLAGIDIGIHYTWLFAFFLFAWLFAWITFPALYPDWSVTTYWIGGVVVSLMIFLSVLVHELSHSLVAISRGMNVNSIVFFIFGGVSNIEKEPERPWVEFIVSGAGPASSLVLGGIFIGISSALVFSTGEVTPLAGVLNIIGVINIYLAVFNILPGFPLDGGRVLRSIVWGATGNLQKATTVAGNVGRVIGIAMIIVGVLLFFNINIWVLQGGFISGIWLVFIGWFLTSAADNAMREMGLQQSLAGVRVRDVMARTPECINPFASVESVVHERFIQHGKRALPVCTESGMLGIVTLADVKRLPRARWAITPIQDIMTRSPLKAVDQEDDLNDALRVLTREGLNQIPVMEKGHLVGLLSRADVLRYLHTSQELGLRQDNPRI